VVLSISISNSDSSETPEQMVLAGSIDSVGTWLFQVELNPLTLLGLLGVIGFGKFTDRIGASGCVSCTQKSTSEFSNDPCQTLTVRCWVNFLCGVATVLIIFFARSRLFSVANVIDFW